MIRAAAAVAAALAMTVAGCSDGGVGERAATSTTGGSPATGAPAATTSGGAATPPFEPAPVRWERCDDLECATVAVPVDYGDPTGARIELALVRIGAGDADQRIGSLLVNPGGPGASGVDYVSSGPFLPDEVHERFDVIGFDPRGVGRSGGLTCGDGTVPAFQALDPDPDSDAEQRALESAAEAVARDCGAAHGSLLAHLGTAVVARDLDTIRRALGETTISYVGFSYGTLLGQRYAELYGDHVRAMVLDGVADPADDLTELLRAQVVAFDQAVTTMFEACEDHSGCPEVGAGAAFDDVAAAVEQAPLEATGGTVGPAELVAATIYAAYLPSLWPSLHGALAAALDGDGTALLSLAHAYRSFGRFTSYVAVSCVDSPHPQGADAYRAFAAELDALSPRFGAALANEMLPCAWWPTPPAPAPGPVQRPGTPPILVIGTTGDPATPYAQAERVAAQLGDAVLLTFEAEGHTATGRSTCVDDAVERYLDRLELPAPGTTCR